MKTSAINKCCLKKFSEKWSLVISKMSSKEINGEQQSGSGRESQCYFCNDMFQMGHLQLHLKQCGSILEQCPLRCGAWIQRRHRESHHRDCPRTNRSRSSLSPTHSRPPQPTPPATPHTWSPNTTSVPLEDCVTYLEKEVANIKLVLTEESSSHEIQSTELETVRSKLMLLEQRSEHLVSVVMEARAALDQQAAREAHTHQQLRQDVANVHIALQELQSQQLATAMRLESAISSLVHEQRERELLERAVTEQDNRIRAVHRLEEIISYIRQTVDEERERNAQSRELLAAELVEARRSSAQLHQLQQLNVQLQSAVHDTPPVDRLSVLELSTAQTRAETADQTARVDTLSRELRAITKSYLKMRAELTDFQARVSLGNQHIGSNDGHLIWRIDNYTARMKEAKEHDTTLTSDMFTTSRYGYTLKAEVNLNGIGKWRGRHITCTVRLVAGQWDSLLEWPCDLAVDILLRDQARDRSQATDIVKSLQLRRKSSSRRHDYDATASTGDDTSRSNMTRSTGDENSRSNEHLDKSVLQLKRQYIFIPHTSLDKFDYIKNDVMFLEFIVNQ